MKSNRIITILLIMVMVVGSIPTLVFAEESEDADGIVAEDVADEQEYEDADEILEIEAEESFEQIDVEEIETEDVDSEITLSGTCGDGVTWVLDDEGKLTVSGSGAMNDYTSSDPAPWYDDRESIKTIEIEDGITTIGSYAFYGCYNLVSVIIPDSITRLNSNAFDSCSALSNVAISKVCKLTTIEKLVFRNCANLTSIVIPENVDSFVQDAFAGCDHITDVFFYASEYAVDWSGNGDNVFMPNKETICHVYNGCLDRCQTIWSHINVTFVDDLGNHSCGESAYVSFDDDGKTMTIYGSGEMYDYNYQFDWYGYKESVEKLIVDEGITYIGKEAFSCFPNLEEVIISEGVERIGVSAFEESRMIQTITIPDSVVSIGDEAFGYCSGLTEVKFGNNSQIENLGEWCFTDCYNLSDITIPKGVSKLEYGLFAYCDSLKEITIPDTVLFISNEAFMGCSVTEIYCYANPYNLIWSKSINSFLDNNETICHVYVDCLSEYQKSFSNINVTFVGDISRISIEGSDHVSVEWNDEEIIPGTTSNFDITPDSGYRIDSITVIDDHGNMIDFDFGNSCFEFPETVSRVTITVSTVKVSGWYISPDGEYHYYDLVTGWKKIDGKYYYFNEFGVMQTGWVKDGGKWYYLDSNGVLITGWKKVADKWYFFNPSGSMQTGWKKISNVYYFFEESGNMVTGWNSISGKYYYFCEDGEMMTGWLKSGGKWYYLDSTGAMAVGWKKIGNKYYYFNSSGAMKTGWIKDGGRWYYLNNDGSMVTGWKKIDGTNYYFDASGAMKK